MQSARSPRQPLLRVKIPPPLRLQRLAPRAPSTRTALPRWIRPVDSLCNVAQRRDESNSLPRHPGLAGSRLAGRNLQHQLLPLVPRARFSARFTGDVASSYGRALDVPKARTRRRDLWRRVDAGWDDYAMPVAGADARGTSLGIRPAAPGHPARLLRGWCAAAHRQGHQQEPREHRCAPPRRVPIAARVRLVAGLSRCSNELVEQFVVTSPEHIQLFGRKVPDRSTASAKY